MSDRRPVGVFDSGIGGLTVWREIRQQLPDESTVYLADQAHLPYGPKPAADVLTLAQANVEFLLQQGCKLIVVACNTASAAALQELRARHPEVPFVGMEPAVKPAAERSRSRVVGVMATPGTLQGRMFADAVSRFAHGVKVINQPCAGLVERIEGHRPDHPTTIALLRGLLLPIQQGGADTLVLACTHYPFVARQIADILGPAVEIIDPAPAVARQLGRVLAERGLENTATDRTAPHRFFTTGTTEPFREMLQRLLQLEVAVERAPRR